MGGTKDWAEATVLDAGKAQSFVPRSEIWGVREGWILDPPAGTKWWSHARDLRGGGPLAAERWSHTQDLRGGGPSGIERRSHLEIWEVEVPLDRNYKDFLFGELNRELFVAILRCLTLYCVPGAELMNTVQKLRKGKLSLNVKQWGSN